MISEWRSPLGGPRYGAAVDEQHAADLEEEWPEERIQAEIEERERARATVTPEGDGLRADGGQRDPLPEVHVGDHVRDRDGEDGTTMLVVGTPVENAGEYDLEDGTVADANPDCPADDDVVEVVYPEQHDVSTRPLTRYAYPRSRVEQVAAIHGGGDE